MRLPTFALLPSTFRWSLSPFQYHKVFDRITTFIRFDRTRSDYRFETTALAVTAGVLASTAIVLPWKAPSLQNDEREKSDGIQNDCLECENSTDMKTTLASLSLPQVLSQSPVRDEYHSTYGDEVHVEKKTFDFVVVGYGTAGRSACRTLRQLCPKATVAVVDPFVVPEFSPDNHEGNVFLQSRLTEFDPMAKECCVAKNGIGKERWFSYRHAILIATGSRGAPPPSYLLDDKAMDHIYELRSTIVPVERNSTTSSLPSRLEMNPESKQSEGDEPKIVTSIAQEGPQFNSQRPVLSPEEVRRLIMQKAVVGSTLVILGSGWDAIDLVISAKSSVPKHSGIRHSIVFGNHGPVCHIVPNYLSVAIAKRLQTKRIQVVDRSLVRYISCFADKRNKKQNGPNHRLQVYTAKSFDFLDGQAISADAVVIAPDVVGARGTGALPTPHIPNFLQQSARGRTSWYHTWSSLSLINDEADSMMVSCYKEDGRVAVNSELCACTGVYAAGSVAKCPNGLTGHAMVAGGGDGVEAGRIAALNMARLYHSTTTSSSVITSSGLLNFGRKQTGSSRHGWIPVAVKDPIPVWRSDVRNSASASNSIDQSTSLEDIGIVALCVGNCDSESLATHGVWWTNQAAQRRLLALSETDDATDDTMLRRKIKRTLKPVYGLGVVYYLDRSGRIQGVMTWGLPFHKNGAKRPLNQELVSQLKNVIQTNGGFRSIETEDDRIEFSKYLGEASKRIVSTAFINPSVETGKAHLLDGALERFPRPLHRYTEVRPPNIRMVGVVKRNDGQGHGVLGQDLFACYEQDDLPDQAIPLPLAGNLGSAIARVKAKYDWDVWEQIERRWDENESRARPPKEDPLWIRKGDEIRGLSQQDRIAAAYSSVLNTQ
jgi:hypothetical protein